MDVSVKSEIRIKDWYKTGEEGTSFYSYNGGGGVTPVGGDYLPLAGGTLTGGLIGTTANFSGNLTSANATFSSDVSMFDGDIWLSNPNEDNQSITFFDSGHPTDHSGGIRYNSSSLHTTLFNYENEGVELASGGEVRLNANNVRKLEVNDDGIDVSDTLDMGFNDTKYNRTIMYAPDTAEDYIIMKRYGANHTLLALLSPPQTSWGIARETTFSLARGDSGNYILDMYCMDYGGTDAGNYMDFGDPKMGIRMIRNDGSPFTPFNIEYWDNVGDPVQKALQILPRSTDSAGDVNDTVVEITNELNTDYIENLDGTFNSGFTGAGWQLKQGSDSEYSLEVDNLKVRNKMSVYELEVRKIRATNGTVMVSNGAKATAGLTWSSSGNYYFNVEAGEDNFADDDIIIAQQYSDGNVYSYEYYVYGTDTGQHRVYVRGLDKTPLQLYSTYDWLDLSNLSMDNISEAASGADLEIIGTTGRFRSAGTMDLTDKVGRLYFWSGWNNISDDLNFTFELKNSAGQTISNVHDNNTAANEMDGYFTLTDTYAYGTGCYFYFSALATAGTTFKIEEFKSYLRNYVVDDIDCTGFDWVRKGNLNDSDRQGSIILTADETNAPYISVLDGIDTLGAYSSTDHKARLGNLTGLSWDGSPTTGYGLYSENTYLTGTIYSYGGYFHQIEEVTFKGDDDDYGIKINGGHIWENEINDDDGYVFINYKGYDGGLTKYRRTVIGNGKGSQMWYASGDLDGGDGRIEHWAPTKFNEGIRYLVTNVTANYTVLQADLVVVNYDTATSNTITMPTGTLYDGEVHTIKNRTGSQSITVSASGVGIDAASFVNSITLAGGSSVTLVYDSTSTNWQVTGSYSATNDGNSW